MNEAGRNLELRVTGGSVLVRVDSQQPHHETTVSAQNLTLAVRGTMFTLSVDGYGSETIVMLSGYAEVNGVELAAGYMLVLEHDAEYDAHEFIIMPITVEAVDYFTLAAIVGNFAYLSYFLDIDLSGIEIDARPLPTPHEIRNLMIEEPEADDDLYCDDDCTLPIEPDILHHRRRQGRC